MISSSQFLLKERKIRIVNKVAMVIRLGDRENVTGRQKRNSPRTQNMPVE